MHHGYDETDVDEFGDVPLPEDKPTRGKKKGAKKGAKKTSKPAKAAAKPTKATKAVKPQKASKPAKSAAKTTNGKAAAKPTKAAEKEDHRHGRGSLRDYDGMTSRMAKRLGVEADRLVNTATREESRGNKVAAKKARGIAVDLQKVVQKLS